MTTQIIKGWEGAFLTKETGPIFLSGGFGSEVDKIATERGIASGSLQKGSSFIAPIDAPEIVKEVHEAYAKAGADILTADTFCANLSRAGQKIIANSHAQAAAAIAREVSQHNLTIPIVGLSLTASGDCYTPDETPSLEELHRDHSFDAWNFRAKGDLVISETLPTLREAQVIAKCANIYKTPFITSVVVDDKGDILDGNPVETLISTVLKPNSFCLGIGVNCCSIEGANKAVHRLAVYFNADKDLKGKHIIAYPNAFKLSREENEAQKRILEGGGTPCCDHNTALTPDEGAEAVRELIRLGASVVGLCCGSTPEHTRAYVNSTKYLKLGIRQKYHPH